MTKIKKIKRKRIKAQISKTKFNLHIFLWEEREKKKRFTGDKPHNC
jgi:hypothetical protein